MDQPMIEESLPAGVKMEAEAVEAEAKEEVKMEAEADVAAEL